jgi:hypothetical protein
MVGKAYQNGMIIHAFHQFKAETFLGDIDALEHNIPA